VLAQLWRDDASSSCRYLFLDEPLTFLDIRHQIDFMKRIRSFTKGSEVVTVGVVHDLNLAARFADQILVLNGGRIVAGGTPPAVLTTECIERVFGVAPTMVQTKDAGLHLIFE
jgi:iron complex transport system ATP-binding protein